MTQKTRKSAGDVPTDSGHVALRQLSVVKQLLSQINTNAQLAGDVPTDSGSNGRPNDELPASCIDTHVALRQLSVVKPLVSQINTNAQLAGEDSGSNGRPNDELPASCKDTENLQRNYEKIGPKDAQICWRPLCQLSVVKPLISQINTNAQLAEDVPTDSGSNGRSNDELPASCIDT
ncbi:23531_t:CDS:2 [Gigaspora rosea]|nr:23531_t:CDS:2 [Gigaspora rosea]